MKKKPQKKNRSKAIGGRARAEALTADQRRKIARKAARARWKNHKKGGCK